MKCLIVFSLLLFVASANTNANADDGFEQYLQGLLNEAKQTGISEQTLTLAKTHTQYRQSVVKADKNQPEKRITLSDYLATRVPDWKVAQAVKLTRENQTLLNQIEQRYGVQSRFIIALWGNESNFGRIQGKHPVLSSLASLAYEGRREALFKSQFFAALTILDEGHIEADAFLGSWAGAMGQSQFMPATFLAYAEDFDGDGKKDIWNNKADALASIANFLKQHGWQKQYTWGRQVNAGAADSTLVGLDKAKAKSLRQWQDIGVTRYNGEALPNASIEAWLIMPDGEQGRHYLVYNNFQTLMRWNRSSYFGVSVSYLSERIKKGLLL